MLHSRARYLTSLSKRLPRALILTAGLGIAGCGGRFLETPTPLSRAIATDEDSGHAALEDAPPEPSTGVRAGARRFLTTLFRRDSDSAEPLRDPFVDTPVFAHAETSEYAQAETSEAPAGVARAADDLARSADRESATASVAPTRTIVRPPRRSDNAAQPAIDEAAARMAAAAAQRPRPQIPDEDLPEWARNEHQTPDVPQLAQREQQRDISPWNEEARVPAYEDRVRIGRLQSHAPGTESAPAESSRQFDSMLAGDAPARRAEPEASAAPQRSSVLERRIARPADQPSPGPEQRATDMTVPDAANVAQHDDELPPWAFAPREQQPLPREDNRSPQAQPPVVANRDVRDLPTHFENVLALAESTAQQPTRRLEPDVSMNAAPPAPETWEPTAFSRTATRPQLDRDPSRRRSTTSESATAGNPFPVLNEWRGVDANLPVEIAEGGDWDGRTEFDIHQTAFEEDSQTARLTASAGKVDVASRSEIAAGLAPNPPLDANAGTRVFHTPSNEQQESGSSSLPWFVALLIAVGLGVFVYRRQLHHGES